MCGICFYLTTNDQTDYKQISDQFMKIQHRGPDQSKNCELRFMSNDGKKEDINMLLQFHRLAIIDKSHTGDQPFIYRNENRLVYLMCNGEIYNYKLLLKEHLSDMIIDGHIKGSTRLISNSDCEVIIPLYLKYGINKTVNLVSNNEFAFILVDITKKDDDLDHMSFYCSRDVAGIRGLFYFKENNKFGFCSELKGLLKLSNNILPFPPGNTLTTDIYYSSTNRELKMMTTIIPYYSYLYKTINYQTIEVLYEKIRNSFINSVKERLVSDRPLGCLLSGGIDSSLVSAVASKYSGSDDGKKTKLKTYTIGMKDGTDIKYAEMVAKYISSDHTTFYFTPEEALSVIPDVIKTIETYDITTIRASVPQYLLAQRISTTTHTKVILNGDGSDEILMGYLYFHNAPDPESAQKDSVRLLKELHKYDVCRVDRTISRFGLEARVPFLSKDFIDTCMNIDPKLKIPYEIDNKKIEKYILRKAFEDMKLLPTEVLWRRKEAFSDAISSTEKSWYQIIQDHIDMLITNEEYKNESKKYKHNPPTSKESYYYRKIFEENFGSENVKIIDHMWLPSFSGNITNPSARILSLY
jgi:asparagine synthase (glutamine-hydrolysing)